MDLLSIKTIIKENSIFDFKDSALHQNDSKDNLVATANTGSDIYDTTDTTEPVTETGTDTSSIENVTQNYVTYIVDDLAAEIPSDHYRTLPMQVMEYFDGVLHNLGDTEYFAYCFYDYNDISGYDVHNCLVYDLILEDDVILPGTYPVIDLMHIDGSNGYEILNTTTSFVEVPDVAYASFGTYSDLRSGFSHTETYTVLLFLGFAVCYAALMGIFSFHKRKNR